jgi:hypothetical protein
VVEGSCGRYPLYKGHKIMDYSTIAQPWAAPSGNAPVLPMRPNNSLFLKHNPRNWIFEQITVAGKKKGDEKAEWIWLPEIQTEYERPGVNGIRAQGSVVDSSGRQAQLARDGWKVILPNEIDYLRVYPCNGGRYYATKFVKLENIAGDVFETYEREEFARFRLELLLNNVIKMPHPSILEKIRLRRARHIDRYVRQQHIPELAAKMHKVQHEVEAMGKAIEAIKADVRKYYGQF